MKGERENRRDGVSDVKGIKAQTIKKQHDEKMSDEKKRRRRRERRG